MKSLDIPLHLCKKFLNFIIIFILCILSYTSTFIIQIFVYYRSSKETVASFLWCIYNFQKWVLYTTHYMVLCLPNLPIAFMYNYLVQYNLLSLRFLSLVVFIISFLFYQIPCTFICLFFLNLVCSILVAFHSVNSSF